VKSEISQTVDALNKQLEQLGKSFSASVLSVIRSQRSQFEEQQKQAEALPYPKRGETKIVVPLKRRPLPISTLPPISRGAIEEPILPEKEYDFILKTLGDMTKVMESAPKDFETLGEEALRSHFLVQLNGHYEGLAKGEVFNSEGKTDILIPWKGKNIFIGECKIYKGPQVVSDALDQLLGYMTWRDTKAALVLLSRNKDFSNVLEQVKNTVKNHSHFLAELSSSDETIFRYQFRQKNDPKRRILLSVLNFNVPQA
jgi:hypothetical protein